MDDQSSVNSVLTYQTTYEQELDTDVTAALTPKDSPNPGVSKDTFLREQDSKTYKRNKRTEQQYNSTEKPYSASLVPTPRNDARGRSKSPGPIVSAETRARWEMLRSLAGVSKEESFTEEEEDSERPGVTSSNHRREENQALGDSSRPEDPSSDSYNPDQIGESATKSSQNAGLIPLHLGDHSDAASMERYLESLKRDPHIDNRGLQEGFQASKRLSSEYTKVQLSRARSRGRSSAKEVSPKPEHALASGFSAEKRFTGGDIKRGRQEIERGTSEARLRLERNFDKDVRKVEAGLDQLGDHNIVQGLEQGERGLEGIARLAESELHVPDVQQDLRRGDRDLKESVQKLEDKALGKEFQEGKHDLDAGARGVARFVKSGMPGLNVRQDIQRGENDLKEGLHKMEKEGEKLEKAEREDHRLEKAELGEKLQKDQLSIEQRLEDLGRSAFHDLNTNGRVVGREMGALGHSAEHDMNGMERAARDGILTDGLALNEAAHVPTDLGALKNSRPQFVGQEPRENPTSKVTLPSQGAGTPFIRDPPAGTEPRGAPQVASLPVRNLSPAGRRPDQITDRRPDFHSFNSEFSHSPPSKRNLQSQANQPVITKQLHPSPSSATLRAPSPTPNDQSRRSMPAIPIQRQDQDQRSRTGVQENHPGTAIHISPNSGRSPSSQPSRQSAGQNPTQSIQQDRDEAPASTQKSASLLAGHPHERQEPLANDQSFQQKASKNAVALARKAPVSNSTSPANFHLVNTGTARTQESQEFQEAPKPSVPSEEEYKRVQQQVGITVSSLQVRQGNHVLDSQVPQPQAQKQQSKILCNHEGPETHACPQQQRQPLLVHEHQPEATREHDCHHEGHKADACPQQNQDRFAAAGKEAVSGPQDMLDIFQARSQASIDAAGGCPGFIDQMIQLLCKMAQDAMPEVERRLGRGRGQGQNQANW